MVLVVLLHLRYCCLHIGVDDVWCGVTVWCGRCVGRILSDDVSQLGLFTKPISEKHNLHQVEKWPPAVETLDTPFSATSEQTEAFTRRRIDIREHPTQISRRSCTPPKSSFQHHVQNFVPIRKVPTLAFAAERTYAISPRRCSPPCRRGMPNTIWTTEVIKLPPMA